MDEIKPCPFCGAEAKTIENTYCECWYIGCSNHNCLMLADFQLYTHATEEEAITAWNRRVQ